MSLFRQHEDIYVFMDGVREFLQFERWSSGWPDTFGEMGKYEVALAVSWSVRHERPYVSELTISDSGEPLAEIASDPDGRRVTLALNESHRRLVKLKEWDEDPSEPDPAPETSADVFEDPERSCLAECLPVFRQMFETTDDGAFFLKGLDDALIDPDQDLPFVPRDPEDVDLGDTFESESLARRFATDMIEGIGRMVLPPLQQVVADLSRLRYLGPIRQTPPRDYQPPRFADSARWSTGLGAWDALHDGAEDFVEEVADWLGDEDKLNSGYRVQRRRYAEIDLADPLIRQLLTGRAFDESDEDARLTLSDLSPQTRVVVTRCDTGLELRPHDVGIGISQVVPVVVTALLDEGRLLAIEQPELHLHPKLQAELGDLFIMAACGERRHNVIIETHSELIPLRLMRRIRESHDGTAEASRPKITSNDVAIHYIEAYEGRTVATPLELSRRGQLLDPWPDGFFEEGFRERFSE